MEKKQKKAWIVAVDMGYGHQRAAYPLKDIAFGGKIINANSYAGIPKKDLKVWRQSQSFYNFISRFKNVPLVGKYAFAAFDKFQSIPPFYPKRNLSHPNFQLLSSYSLIKKGWGQHFVKKIKKEKIPLVTTFFLPAYMAEEHGFEQDIYLIICDTDISRAWAPLHPSLSRIKYLAPNYRVAERLRLYGVPQENIILSGFPLPKENLGTEKLEILKKDFQERLAALDPEEKYIEKYKKSFHKPEIKKSRAKRKRPLTLMFAVGGAGAQRELGVTLTESFARDIKEERLKIILVAGIHNDVNAYFQDNLKKIGLGGQINKGIEIIFASNKEDYFQKFNLALRRTDVLWTKPSELSFYVALGLPIIIAPPIGSQEKFNRQWLTVIGAGISQEDPRYAHEWFWQWQQGGILAKAAISGYLEAEKYGTFNIEKILFAQGKGVKINEKYLQY